MTEESAPRGAVDMRAIRRAVKAREPVCSTPGCDRRTVQVDPIVRLDEGGAADASNFKGKCRPCHNRKRDVRGSAWLAWGAQVPEAKGGAG